ncbi:hypothetical protein [Anaeromyxobacter paludicola]|uniref:Clp R domain-containing protein n=1 Tax=Anaeromyxobacter paludicola TaxID=2918171 RepID=A0ABN6ND43_9BACT|nr:hypothetical protein [Anaeromyxobacter paludicola]BDG10064.1 hypothetical protein AMPC_31770 [Anaeromyxobacter paludicola]
MRFQSVGVCMPEQELDPTVSPFADVRAVAQDAPPIDPAALKAQIAATVRSDSESRRAITPEHLIQALAPELPADALSVLLSEMAAEGGFTDIKAIVAPSGRIYLFSEPHLGRNEAAEQALVEEARLAIVEKIRRDSQFVALTPAADLERFFPWPEPEKRAALLAELQADPRFGDIQTVTGPGGEVYYHSNAYLSGNYGKIMMRAKANDPGWAIAELVRDRSRVMPAPTRITVFDDRVFGLSPDQIQGFLGALGEPGSPFADIKKLVHPTTGAVYLYSDQWLPEAAAFASMDWDEVGARQNP